MQGPDQYASARTLPDPAARRASSALELQAGSGNDMLRGGGNRREQDALPGGIRGTSYKEVRSWTLDAVC